MTTMQNSILNMQYAVMRKLMSSTTFWIEYIMTEKSIIFYKAYCNLIIAHHIPNIAFQRPHFHLTIMMSHGYALTNLFFEILACPFTPTPKSKTV